MFQIVVLIFGLFLGSFLNVCIYRIPRNESISYPPSHCTNCNTRIKLYDLIPVISYFILGGKCRKCRTKISLKYPTIELFTGIMFLLVFLKYGFSMNSLKYFFLISVLIPIGIIDYETTDVYFKMTLTGMIGGIIFAILGQYLGNSILDSILGGLLGGGVIALIILLTHGMGWGDFEICLMCGLFLGFKLTGFMLFSSFIFGGIVGGILLLLKIKKRGDYIPFGPVIVLGAIFTIYFGESIMNWYFSLI